MALRSTLAAAQQIFRQEKNHLVECGLVSKSDTRLQRNYTYWPFSPLRSKSLELRNFPSEISTSKIMEATKGN